MVMVRNQTGSLLLVMDESASPLSWSSTTRIRPNTSTPNPSDASRGLLTEGKPVKETRVAPLPQGSSRGALLTRQKVGPLGPNEIPVHRNRDVFPKSAKWYILDPKVRSWVY